MVAKFLLLATTCIAAAQSLVWTQLPNTTIPTGDGIGAAVLNGKLYSINRWYNNISYNDVYFSADGQTWTASAVPRPFTGRHSAPTVVHQGRIFVIGGDASGGAYQPEIYSWDGLETSSWRAEETSFSALNRIGHFAFSLGTEICFGGGQTWSAFSGTPTVFFTDLWCSPTGLTGTWVKVRDELPLGIRGFISGVPVIAGEAYFVAGGTYQGGDYVDRQYTNSIAALGGAPNYTVRLINPKNQMPPIEYNAVAQIRGVLVSVGGWNGANQKTVWASYDKGKTVVQLPDYPGPATHAATLQEFNDSLYLWGGLTGGQQAWRLDYIDESKIHYGKPPNGTTNMTAQYTTCDLTNELTPGKTVVSVGLYLNAARPVRPRIGYRSAPGIYDTTYRAATTSTHNGGSKYQDFPVGNFVVPGPGYYVCFTLAYGAGTPDAFSFGAYSRAAAAGDVLGNGVAFSEPNDGTLPMRWTEQ